MLLDYKLQSMFNFKILQEKSKVWFQEIWHSWLLTPICHHPKHLTKFFLFSCYTFTYTLKNSKYLSCTCVTFDTTAYMTWELLESEKKHFITTIISGSDLVPIFSTSSIYDLRFWGHQILWIWHNRRPTMVQTRKGALKPGRHHRYSCSGKKGINSKRDH